MQIIALSFLFFFILLSEINALELKKELVILEVDQKNNVHVFVDFEMEGTVEKGLAMAFPETDVFELKAFQVFWHGKQINVYKKIAKKNHQYTIGSLRLPAIFKFSVPPSNATKHRLKTTYSYSALPMSGTKSPRGIYLEYILQTGAKWDHSIGEVKFLIRGRQDICQKIYVLPDSYKGTCNENGEYSVILQNIEPDKDFRYILTDEPIN